MPAHDWQQLSALLDELLDLEGEARSQRLRELDASSPAVAKRLREMLELDAQHSDFLTQPLIEPGEGGPQIDDRIGPYTLLRSLGEGGMGHVWLAARSDGMFERKVALKLLRPGYASPTLRTRFSRERHILARLAHPNIARLIDAGVDTLGQPFLALEYIDGVTITQYTSEHALSIDDRLDLYLQVCAAVSHAHASLIVHRDLKPSNILVTPAGQVRLLDFGIAKLLDAPDDDDTALTRAGAPAFTLHYAAPEQLRHDPVTTMTDVYALGVVLYELLTGRKPYRLDGGSDAQWELSILQADPPRPSLVATKDAADPKAARQLARTLAGDLDNIVLKALRKLPEQRYGSVEALAGDIRNYLSGRPVKARPQSMVYRVSKFIGRHAVGLGVSALVALSVGIAMAGILWKSREALLDAERARAMQQFVIGLFETAGRGGAGGSTDVRTLLDSGISRAELDLAMQPQARADLLGMVAQLRNGLGDYPAAIEALNRQDLALRELPRVPDALALQGGLQRARALRGMADLSGCMQVLEPLQPLARARASDDASTSAGLLTELGRCHLGISDFAGARSLFEEALHLRQNGTVAEVESRIDIAQVDAEAGSLNAALDALQVALTHIRAIGAERGAVAVALWRNMGMIYRTMGDLERADGTLREALEVALLRLGTSHPDALDVQRQLGLVWLARGKVGDAARTLDLVENLSIERLGPGHPDTVQAQLALAQVELQQSELAHAEQRLRSVLALTQSQRPPLVTADALLWLSHAAHARGDLVAALATATQADTVLAGLPGRSAAIERVRVLQQLAVTHIARGEARDALVPLQQAETNANTWLGTSHPFSLDVQIDRIHALLQLRENDRADALSSRWQPALAMLGDVGVPLRWRLRAIRAEDACRQGQASAGMAQFEALRVELDRAPISPHLKNEMLQLQVACGVSMSARASKSH